MIEKPEKARSHDRLTAFIKAFKLRAMPHSDTGAGGGASLFVLGENTDRISHVVFRSRGGLPVSPGKVQASALIDFGGALNPLVGALPEELGFALESFPQMHALAGLFAAESEVARCGGPTVRDRICEVIVVLAIRRAIADGPVNAGLLAGLAHAQLCPCLIAMHDEPARHWHVEALAGMAGMSRSSFSTLFARVVGKTPLAYLTRWRLALGHYRLRSGQSVKAIAADVGFGSQAAFSRAFAREYGYAPSTLKREACELPRPSSDNSPNQ
jgi:AraC-like DNA-binding protein